ncbi:MAG: hypothetical protein IH856_20140 [Deltaproteobacteria bacterium]|nr:hypothetical protein [Deltaproteobacteria bacterium]
MKDQQTKSRFVELRAKGWSYDRIAKDLKTSKQTLINWSRELSLEISNLRAMELEVLQEKYYLLKEKRIQLFGEKLKALKEELEKRDLKEVPTEKLFDLFFKCQGILEREAVETVFQEKTSTLGFENLMEKVNTWKA